MGRATSKGNETPFRHAHTEVRTRMVVICDPMHYQLEQTNAGISWIRTHDLEFCSAVIVVPPEGRYITDM